MAKIRKIYEDATRTTQVYPQTHEKAVIDNNGTTLDSKLGQITDIVNQKQMAVGTVPSDITPSPGSTNWPTSGGVYDAIFVNNAAPSSRQYYRYGLVDNAYTSTSIRISVKMPTNFVLLNVSSIASGYRVVIQAWMVSDPNAEPTDIVGSLVYNSGWNTSPFTYIPNGTVNYVIVGISKSNDADITIQEAIDNVSLSYATNTPKWIDEIEKFNENVVKPLHYGYVSFESFNLTFKSNYSNVVQTNFEEGKKYRITIRFSVAPPQYVGVYLYVSTPSSGTQGFTLVGIQAGTQETTFEYVPASGLNYNYMRCYTNSTAALSATFTSEVYTEKDFVDISEVASVVDTNTKLPTNKAVIDFIGGTSGNRPSSAEGYMNASFNSNIDGFRNTGIRCLLRLPMNVSKVTFTSVTNGYSYDFNKFVADDPSKELFNITGFRPFSSGWQTSTPQSFDCSGANLYLVHVKKNNDANITPEEAFDNLTFTYDTAPAGQVEPEYNINSADFTPVSTSGAYIDLTAHRCFRKWEFASSLYNLQDQSPQGSAIFGDYLFTYFYSDATLRVFDIHTGELLSSIPLSGVMHGNSLQFGDEVQDTGFPYLYISGVTAVDTVLNTIFCCKVSLESAEVVRTISLDSHALSMQNCAIDFAHEKLYAATFESTTGGNVKIVRYDVSGLESSTAATYTPTYEADNTFPFFGVIQGVSFCNNSFLVLVSDYDVTNAKLFFINNLQLVDTWTWYMNDNSECQGVTPVYQDGRYIMVIPCWWRYEANQAWYYRLQYIN